ncbi:SH3 domain-containing protein [Comamonas antarctica]|uniref:SH3 domain-containing protein n=1 Tax=Comamonas antarctica TaxID=2743470 RepID=A0A6N1X9K2_9BURK|nr:SH3 domain-containing protein [Comamonas antarctica]QKV55478.1 SH3 domain-containing protein [Comamonas antarctica]
MRKMLSRLGFVAFAALMMTSFTAQAQSRVDVKFPRGSSGTTIDGSIRGDQTISYRLRVSAGQRMSIQLDTDNASNYFNVSAPGASEALYNSSINGNSTSFVVPSSGTYAISVYLMRNAARRNETAHYQLTVSVENAAAQVHSPAALPAPVAAPHHADGLDGGPDLWKVAGLGRDDLLNVRTAAAADAGAIATVRNGDVLRNFGCTMTAGARWCQIETAQGQRGWVAGRYLQELSRQAMPALRP